MKILGIISRIFVGLVFTFSGFVKAIDPLGSTYKFTDYFSDAFHLPMLEPVSFPFAIIMSALELGIGIMLIFNLKHKIAAWGALLLMAFFTPLTLYLSIYNPVHDCGCFGDALVLSNWETFWKNIVISAFVLILFFMRNKLTSKLKSNIQLIAIAVVFVLSISLEFFNYANLPIIDFRPYKIGTYIPYQMIIPEGAVEDEYKTTLVYENSKTSEVKEFTEEEYPWDDSTWVWKDSKSVLIKEGYKPPIHDFTIVSTVSNEDITNGILEDETPIYLIVSYNLNKTNLKGLQKIYDKIEKQSGDYKIYCLTASLQTEIDSISQIIAPPKDMIFCNTDEITLKTIVRSNPGLVLLEKGTVIDKWHY